MLKTVFSEELTFLPSLQLTGLEGGQGIEAHSRAPGRRLCLGSLSVRQEWGCEVGLQSSGPCVTVTGLSGRDASLNCRSQSADRASPLMCVDASLRA